MIKNFDCLKLINYIEKLPECQKLLQRRTKLLIAYSGGQDSTALLNIFYILSQKWSFKLAVVYCNHGWSIDQNVIFNVFNILNQYKIPLYLVDVFPNAILKSENEARKWRYAAFEEVKKKGQYDFLLTGHTLTDKTETIIFNLCRGTGLKGVSSCATRN